jgi:2-polyprenyl-3-methyl-5-hydroxy-6-metoxy-1,4-benzoquinol methylase
MNLEERFSRIVSSNAWGSKETPCGPGSTLAACAEIIQKLPVWIRSLNIKSIVDLGCGDFHWLKEVDLSGIEYDGYDIVRAAIEGARKYASKNIRFHHADILSIDIKRADLVLCKDVLIHLPDQDVLSLLRSIRENGSRFLASTTAPGWPNIFRAGMNAGEFAPIDLQQTPYDLGNPIDMIEVPRKETNPKKFLALWNLRDILETERRSL